MSRLEVSFLGFFQACTVSLLKFLDQPPSLVRIHQAGLGGDLYLGLGQARRVQRIGFDPFDLVLGLLEDSLFLG